MPCIRAVIPMAAFVARFRWLALQSRVAGKESNAPDGWGMAVALPVEGTETGS